MKATLGGDVAIEVGGAFNIFFLLLISLSSDAAMVVKK